MRSLIPAMLAFVSLRGGPPAQLPPELEAVSRTFEQADTVYGAFTLPCVRPVANHLHAHCSPRLIARFDPSGFVVDSSARARLLYDDTRGELSLDDGLGPQTLSPEASAVARAVFNELRTGFRSARVFSVAPGSFHIVSRPHELWFEVVPARALPQGLRILVSALDRDGIPRQLALIGPQGRPLESGGLRMLADIDQLDTNVPLEGDMRSRAYRPWHELGTPAVWRNGPATDDSDLSWHERLDHHMLGFNPAVGQPAVTPKPEPMAQVLAFACPDAKTSAREVRTFVWDVDPAAPSFPYLADASARGCALTLTGTAATTARLSEQVDGLVQLQVVARDLSRPNENLWTQTVRIETAGPDKAYDRAAFSWTLPPALPLEHLRVSVTATTEGSCRAATAEPSTVRASFEGLDAPMLAWRCTP